MNVFGHFKKIFNSFDFMGNRIKRLRVDTPEKFIDDTHPVTPANPQYREDLEGHTPDEISASLGKGPNDPDYNEVDYERYKDFVANKDYVDKRTTYKSERARNQEEGKINSTKLDGPSDKEALAGIPGPEKKNNARIKRTPSQFPWMKGVFGKPHEEVLDELLYPRIPYTYKYPVITDIHFRTDELLVECLESNTKTNKFIIMQNMENNLFIEIFIDNGDWSNTGEAKLVFTKNDGSTLTYTNGIQSGPTHPVLNLENIKIPDNIVKVEFHQKYSTYKQHYDTWGYQSHPELPTHIMIVDITDEFLKQCYPWNLKTKQLVSDKYTDSYNKIYVAAGIVSNKYFKVTNPIDKNYYLECLIYSVNANNSPDQLLNTTIINQEEISSTGEVVYNFGYYPESVYIKFRPIPLTISEKFVQGD